MREMSATEELGSRAGAADANAGRRARTTFNTTDEGYLRGYATGYAKAAKANEPARLLRKVVSYTASIDDRHGSRECGSTGYERAVEQLRTAEDAVAKHGGLARLYGNCRNGKRVVLAECRA